MQTQIFTHDFWGIWQVVPQTLALSILILSLAIVGGLLLNSLRQSRIGLLQCTGRLYVSYFRGVPLLIHLLVAYYALPVVLKAIFPQANTDHLSPMYSVILSYVAYSSAFTSEIIRGSFRSVTLDQIEAGRASGYTALQIDLHIRIPQALSEAVPKFLNYYVLLIRQLSLAFTVSFIDIFAKAKLESAINYRYIESFCAAAVVYWILCATLTYLFHQYEKYLRRYENTAVNA